jgi:hypothetical protein
LPIPAFGFSNKPGSAKAIINIFLAGGPSHIETWDPKPGAPSEIRGSLGWINTKTAGWQVSELFPQIADISNNLTCIKSITGAGIKHDSFQCYSGWPDPGHPCVGSVLSKLRGPTSPAVPPFVGLAQRTLHEPWGDPGNPGTLGTSFGAYRPDSDSLSLLRPDIPASRLASRELLLLELDRMSRDADRAVGAAAENSRLAFEVLRSPKFAQAMDLSLEDPTVRARYGTGLPFNYQLDGAPTSNEQLLLARRLVEVGVRCVTISYGRWDAHFHNERMLRDHGPKFDQCFSALIEDLAHRGMLEDTLVIAWGEFGRTPKINKEGGRDHWPAVNCALLAGGGLPGGLVLGSTNKTGETIKERPVSMQEVVATLYYRLGIDAASTHVPDRSNRPIYPVTAQPIAELI